jgi:hypothetical protein
MSGWVLMGAGVVSCSSGGLWFGMARQPGNWWRMAEDATDDPLRSRINNAYLRVCGWLFLLAGASLLMVATVTLVSAR